MWSTRKKELKPIEKGKTKNTPKKQKVQEKEQLPLEENKQYTIEDLIEVCTKLEARKKMSRALKIDEKALELKNINLERKIKNANIYLNEIELHKKSIFEFWKFTNKDELPSLNEGEEDESTPKEKIGKSFDYEEDIEDFGKKVDEVQRRKLSKNEKDAVFAIKQDLSSAQILNNTKTNQLSEEQKKLLENNLNKLREEYEKNIDSAKIKDFDIFGGLSEDNTKVINNTKHREVEKNKYRVLNITKQIELDVYIDMMRNYLNLLKEAFSKILAPQDIHVYMTSNSELNTDNLNILHLDINKAIADNVDKDEIFLYKINIKEAMPTLYYSNIILFENTNQTLPLGMNLSDEVLVDLSKYKLEETNKEEFKMNYLQDEYTNRIIKVHCIEYNVK